MFGNAAKVYKTNEYQLKTSGVVTRNELKNLSDKALDKARAIYKRCKELGYDIITAGDVRYPAALRKIEMPPLVLFTKGDNSLIGKKGVAIVGTRSASSDGKKTSFDYAYNLAKSGMLVVSGGAQGIDTQAHLGAIRAGGKTICVLGGGLNHKYLAANAAMREEISETGLLISEYPPDFEPSSYTFPKRNRLISAFSDCTLVVEAGMNSGSLITAYAAREQRKPVFAAKKAGGGVYSAGVDMLIKDGAYTANDYHDILTWYENSAQWDSSSQRLTSEMIEEIRLMGKRKKHKEVYTGNAKTIAADTDSEKTRSEEIKTNGNVYSEAENNNKLFNINEKNASGSAKKEKIDNFLKDMLTENALSVYDTISEIPIYVDDIRTEAKLNISEVLAALTELEIVDLIQSLPNGKFVRK